MITPRQRLKESLQKNTEYIEKEWTAEMRAVISTRCVFNVQLRPQWKKDL